VSTEKSGELASRLTFQDPNAESHLNLSARFLRLARFLLSRRVVSFISTILTLALCALSLPPLAEASLGGDAQSVASDSNALSARSGSPESHERYTVTTLQADSTTVREYADLSGHIFAVAWDGLTQPDLSTLLGPLYDEYQQESGKQEHVAGRRNSRGVASRNVVVQTSGHMRRQTGRAYLHAKIPAGVSVAEIK
jgi:hypothetical protein